MLSYLPLFSFSLSILALLYSTYSDFKYRIVPNWLNYGLVVVGLLSYSVISIVYSDFSFLIISIVSVVIAFGFSYLLWRLGVWAGGDVKLFTGLAALNPINYVFIGKSIGLGSGIFAGLGYPLPIFPLSLFIFSILSMFPYAILLTISKLSARADLRKLLFLDVQESVPRVIFSSFFLVGLYNLFAVFSLPNSLYLPAFILVILLVALARFSKNKVFGVFSFLIFMFALYTNLAGYATEFVYLVALLFTLNLLIKLATYMRQAMRKDIKIKDLEEGMIVSELLVERGNKLVKEESPTIGTILNYLKDNNLEKVVNAHKIDGKVLASPRSAAGLTDENLRRVKELAKGSGIESIKITESAPFVPAVLIGYVALQIVGDVFWILLI